MECRACGQHDETQKHVLQQCTTLHKTDQSKVDQTELFNENPTNLRTTAIKLQKVMEGINKPPTQDTA